MAAEAVDTSPHAMSLPGLSSEGARAAARQQAAILAFGKRSNARPRISVLMQDAVALVVESLDAHLGGVGEVTADRKSVVVRVGKVGTLGKTLDAAVHKYPMAPDGSMAAYALREAAPIVSSHLGEEKRFTDLFLREQGVSNAMTIPLHIDNRPFGLIGVYRCDDRGFSPDDVRFAETIASLLTASVSRLKTEDELRKQRSAASAMLDVVEAMVVTLDPEGAVVDMNRAAQELSGFSLSELRGREFWSKFAVPEEVDRFQASFRGLVCEKTAQAFDGTLLRKDNARRYVRWTGNAVFDDEGEVESVVLSGVDRTETIKIQTQLERLRKVALTATEELEAMRKGKAPMTAVRSSGSQEPGDSTDASRPAQGPLPPTNVPAVVDSRAAPEESTQDPAVADADQSGAESGSQASPLGPEAERQSPFAVLGAPQGLESRTSPRRTYQYKQRVAPMYGGSLPSPKSFFEAECKDISAGGFSFYLKSMPDFETLVIGLGHLPMISYFTARVARVMQDPDSGRILVGCRFTGRVHM